MHSVLYRLVLEMMTSVLKMISPLGIYFFSLLLASYVYCSFGCLYFFFFWAQFDTSCRREALWPELDTLLREEGDTAVATPYTAAVLEYRVSIHDSEDAILNEKNLANGNGHTVFDAQHPYRYSNRQLRLVVPYNLVLLHYLIFLCFLGFEGQMSQ